MKVLKVCYVLRDVWEKNVAALHQLKTKRCGQIPSRHGHLHHFVFIPAASTYILKITERLITCTNSKWQCICIQLGIGPNQAQEKVVFHTVLFHCSTREEGLIGVYTYANGYIALLESFHICFLCSNQGENWYLLKICGLCCIDSE